MNCLPAGVQKKGGLLPRVKSKWKNPVGQTLMLSLQVMHLHTQLG